jgi:hypothetical protein
MLYYAFNSSWEFLEIYLSLFPLLLLEHKFIFKPQTFIGSKL